MAVRTVVFALALGACSDPVTTVVVDVAYDETWQLDELAVTADGVRSSVAIRGDVTLLLPDSSAGHELRIEVDGLHAAESIAHASTVVTPVAGDEVHAPIVLAPLSGLADEGRALWDSSEPPIKLGPEQDRLCFLTLVSGTFNSDTSTVSVSVVDGMWTLAGSAGGVRAEARCIRWSAAATGIVMSPEAQWTQGQGAVDMGPATNQLCVLTRMAGLFGGATDLITTRVQDGHWLFGGAAAQFGVAASARCLAWPESLDISFSEEAHWSQGLPPQSLGPTEDRVCALTMITGAFVGTGERVSVVRGAVDWIVDGTSGTSAVAANARCLAWKN